jgi:hypothetical protein
VTDDYAEQCAQESWERFQYLPGVRIHTEATRAPHPVSALLHNYITLRRRDGACLAVVRRSNLPRGFSRRLLGVSIHDKTFRVRNHMSHSLVLDDSGETLMTVRGWHRYRRAGAIIQSSDGHRWNFPVLAGKKRKFATMTAVDESGRTHLTFARPQGPRPWHTFGPGSLGIEIVVDPAVTADDEILLVTAVALPLLDNYFVTGGG